MPVMHCIKWLLLIVLILAAGRFLLLSLLQALGNYLVFRQKTEKAECIVILSGERGERVTYGVKLYKEGCAPKIILSGGPGESGYPESLLMREQAIREGVREEDVITETRSRSTYENALFVKEICEEKGFHSFLLVTSPYHSRRAYMHFRRRFEGSGIRVISSPAEDAWFNPKEWWKRPRDLERLVMEYLSFTWHLLWQIREWRSGKRPENRKKNAEESRHQ